MSDNLEKLKKEIEEDSKRVEQQYQRLVREKAEFEEEKKSIRKLQAILHEKTRDAELKAELYEIKLKDMGVDVKKEIEKLVKDKEKEKEVNKKKK